MAHEKEILNLRLSLVALNSTLTTEQTSLAILHSNIEAANNCINIYQESSQELETLMAESSVANPARMEALARMQNGIAIEQANIINFNSQIDKLERDITDTCQAIAEAEGEIHFFECDSAGIPIDEMYPKDD